jgi:curved DNA-binding protein CbpA
MMPRPNPALLQALALMRAPRGPRPGPGDSLPDGVESLLRIVAGDAQALSFAVRTTREAEATVRDAAAFYIQQVMFASGSDSYRVLGLDPSASDEQLKSHHRLLTRWLHPDRNRDEWEAIYSERVNRAWQDLRNSERRQRYDRSRTGAAAAGTFHSGKHEPAANQTIHLEGEPGLSLRWLPHAILGGLGLSAAAIVALYYVLRFSNAESALSEARTEVDGRFESSALAKARSAQGDVQVSAFHAPQKVASTSAAVPRPSGPGAAPSTAVATPKSLVPTAVSTPAQALLAPIASAPLPSVSGAGGPASVATSDLVRPRKLPRQEEIASNNSGGPSQGQHLDTPTASASIPVGKPEIRSSPGSALVSQREADRIVGRFSEVYAHGDLAGMRAMFTPDASSPDGGLDDIMDEYDRLFERSKHRLLAVREVNWSATGNTFTIFASYEATVKSGLLSRRHSRGRLRLDMRQENEQWRIYRLEHHERID